MGKPKYLKRFKQTKKGKYKYKIVKDICFICNKKFKLLKDDPTDLLLCSKICADAYFDENVRYL